MTTAKPSTDADGCETRPQQAHCYRRLQDIERMSSVRFRFDNSVRWARVGAPIWRDTATGLIVVDKPFELVGWCDKMPTELMHGREGQIGLMMWHEEFGDIWEHYPLFDEDDRAAAKFVSR